MQRSEMRARIGALVLGALGVAVVGFACTVMTDEAAPQLVVNESTEALVTDSGAGAGDAALQVGDPVPVVASLPCSLRRPVTRQFSTPAPRQLRCRLRSHVSWRKTIL